MIQLNLLPDIKLEYIRAQRTKRFFVLTSIMVAAGAIALVVLLAMFVYGVQRTHSSNLEDDIKDKLAELQQKEDLEKILTVQKQLDTLPQLHKDKPIVSRLFNYFTVIIPNDVSISSSELMFGNTDEEVTIELAGLGLDFKTVNIFADSLKNAEFTSENVANPERAFSNVTLDTIDKNDETASFTIFAEINSKIFDAEEETIKLTVPEIISSPSVTERPGRLFDAPQLRSEEPQGGS